MEPEEFLDHINTSRAAWEAQMARVRHDQMTAPGAVGKWSVKDLVAHITWSEREMVGMLETRALVGSDLWSLTNDQRNEIVYQQNRDRPLGEVLAEAEDVYSRLLALVSGMSAAELNDPGQFANMPADWLPWRIIAGNTYIHYQEHAQNLKDWLDKRE
jgi:DinB superfamily